MGVCAQVPCRHCSFLYKELEFLQILVLLKGPGTHSLWIQTEVLLYLELSNSQKQKVNWWWLGAEGTGEWRGRI
jgi:hypothetical protein